MAPQESKSPNGYHKQPTSPWTEAYQATPGAETARAARKQHDAARRSKGNEAQQPTTDALSAIYNRGY